MKFSISRSNLIKITSLILIVGIFFIAAPAHAAWREFVVIPFAWMFAALTYALGAILMVLMYILVWVAGYNDFINAEAVRTGWEIVRDVCNMFFILILLVIAFATTLNRESYGMKRLLPKFILAAIFINFSKLICGVIIDFAQVIMLTFVNGFRDIGPGNLTAMLGINSLLDFTRQTPEDASLITIFGSYVLAFLYVLIAVVVIVVILFVLVMRMVMIWIYVVLSPLAYLLMVLPATEKYAKQWWDQFIQNVVSGPVLAFFIWLSFAAVSITSTGSSILSDTPPPNQTENESAAFAKLSQPSAGVSEAGTPDGMLKILVSIGMLMGGLMVTKQLGGAAGSIAGSGLDKIKKGAYKVRDWGGEKGLVAAKATGRGAIGATGWGLTKASNVTSRLGARIGTTKLGGKLGISSNLGSGMRSSGKFMSDWREDLKETRMDEKRDKRKKTLEKFGMKEKSMESLKQAAATPFGKAIGATMLSVNPAAGGLYGAVGSGVLMATKGLAKRVGGIITNKQINKDKKKADKAVDTLLDKKVTEKEQRKKEKRESMEKDRDIKLSTNEKDRTQELDKAKLDYERDRVDSVRGADNPAEVLKNIDDAYQQKLKDIADKYDGVANNIKGTFTTNLAQEEANIDTDVEKKYTPKIERARTYAQQARDQGYRASDLEKNEKDRKSELKAIDQRQSEEVLDITKNFKGSKLMLDQELSRVNDKYAGEKKNANKKFDTKKTEIETQYKDAPPVDITGLRYPASELAKSWQEHDANKITIKAAKEGTKEWTNAKELVAAMGRGEFKQAGAGDFSSLTENLSKHKKFYDELAADKADSRNAINAMIRELESLEHGDPEELKKKSGMIEALKRGIARYVKKKPENKGAFSTLISQLNNTNRVAGKAVEDYTPKE